MTIPLFSYLSTADRIGTLSEHYRNITESVRGVHHDNKSCLKHVLHILTYRKQRDCLTELVKQPLCLNFELTELLLNTCTE